MTPAGYANARDLLPPALIRKIQRRFGGGLLWVPAPARRLRKTRNLPRRDRSILRERRRGASVARLAERHGLTSERIRQILLRQAKN